MNEIGNIAEFAQFLFSLLQSQTWWTYFYLCCRKMAIFFYFGFYILSKIRAHSICAEVYHRGLVDIIGSTLHFALIFRSCTAFGLHRLLSLDFLFSF